VTQPAPLRTVVWGTGNMGRAAVRAVAAHPGLLLTAVVGRSLAGQDAGTVAGLDPLGVAVDPDVDAALAGADAVVYTASGDLRPDDALADLCRCLRAGAVVVTPSVYALYDPRNADPATREAVRTAAEEGGGALLVSGIDPGWGNDVLPLLLTGLGSTITQVRCQELFDYSTYDAPDAVRGSVGMGLPMDQTPLMVLPTVPTMIWGGQLRMLARALDVELDEITEHVERRALDADVTNAMGLFEKGTQGGLRFEVRGWSGGEVVLVVEHVTRIDPSVAPDWPAPASGAKGAHRVVLEGRPRLEVTVEATDEPERDPSGQGNSAAGGNATAAARLVNAVPWLRAAAPGVYDALDVPLSPAVGRLGRRKGASA
jgi:2,4-diaminopentanoate dehydrogenase